MPWCGGGSGDPEALGSEVLVLAPGTARGIVELRTVFESKTALVAGWRVNLEPPALGDGAADVLKVIDDDLLGHHEVPGQFVQGPLPLPEHRHDLLSPRQLHCPLT